MELDRRQAILSVAMALVARPARAKPERIESELHECHQLTRSLIERARLACTATNRVDLDAIDRLIRQTADRAAIDSPPVIKWLTSPTDAFDHLRKLNSSELGTNLAALWRVRRSCLPCNEEAFERSFGVRQLASDILRPDEYDRILMAPKLSAISETRRAGASPTELRRVRAACFEIGWLETSLPTLSSSMGDSLALDSQEPGSLPTSCASPTGCWPNTGTSSRMRRLARSRRAVCQCSVTASPIDLRASPRVACSED